MTPLTAEQALERYFLEARCRLMDLAGILDRISRGQDFSSVRKDPRLERIRAALRVLQNGDIDRAERIQQIFSLPYEANWATPKSR